MSCSDTFHEKIKTKSGDRSIPLLPTSVNIEKISQNLHKKIKNTDNDKITGYHLNQNS